MRKNIFKGSGVALITPFLSDFSIDFDRLRHLTEDLITHGVDFLCVLGTTAETATMDAEEQQQVVQTVLEVNQGRLPVLLGVGTNNTQSVLKRLQSDSFAGIDGLLVVTPYYNKPSQEGLYQHYRSIASHTLLPVVLYNVPGRTGVNMTAETTLRIANDCPNVVAIKEASGNLAQIKTIIDTAPEGFEVISGDDSLVFELINAGATGAISVIGNALPTLFSEMIHHLQKKEIRAALTLQKQCRPLYAPLFVDGNPSGIKSLLFLQGKIENHLRLPLVPATAKTQEELRRCITDFPVY